MNISVKNLYKAYGENEVLKDYSYDFPERGIVCITGPSGCGKTTLVNIIMGLIKPDSGTIEGRQGGIACAFQEDRLLPWNTLFENIYFVCDKNKALRAEQEEVCEKWISAMELSDSKDKYPDELSGGMKRRVALARAMVRSEDADCHLIVMDEPFKGLDGDLKLRIMSKVTEGAKDKLLIVITHDKEEAAFLSENIIEFTKYVGT